MQTERRVKLTSSTRFRLAVLVSLLIFALTSMGVAFNTVQGAKREIQSQRTALQGTASAYAAALADPLATEDLSASYALLRGIRDLPQITYAGVLDDKRIRFVELGSGAVLAEEMGELWQMTDKQIWDAGQLRLETPIIRNGEAIGTFRMTADISELQASVWSGFTTTLLFALGAMIVGLVTTYFLIRQLTKPLHQLTQKISEYEGQADFSLGDLANRKDESGVLVAAFNDMMGGIQERDLKIAENVRTLEDKVETRTHDLRVAKEQAEAANAAKSNFLATMSHEIRTPMNGLMVMAEMLSSADLSTRHRRYADIIQRSGQSLLTIINDILDLSKVEAGKLDLEAVPVSPDMLVADVASLFAERAREKGLELVTYVDPNVPASVLGDPTRLNQVLSNLVNNALKFTETGGVIVSLKRSERSCAENEVALELHVRDTGIGIPADKLDTIFDAFTQADQSTTRKYGGTGLGLSVCSKLADAMGGKMSIQSKEGKGSIFTLSVTLPIHDAQFANHSSGNGLKIALAVDAPLIERSLELFIKAYGAERVDLADAGADAVFASVTQINRVKSVQAPVICLSDVGDGDVDRLLRDGTVKDLLPVPVLRGELAGLFNSIRSKSFRGVDVLKAQTPERKHSQSFKSLRVLAADDNAVNREVLAEALRILGVSAEFAENGEIAVARVKETPFDIVFMDGSMPVLDGFEATRQIRAFEAETGRAPVKIQALTARVHGKTPDSWNAAGADGYITKPFTIDRIAEALSTVSAPKDEISVASDNPQTTVPVEDQPLSSDTAQLEAGLPLVDTEETLTETDEIFDPTVLDMFANLSQSSGSDMRERVWTMFVEKGQTGVSDLQNMVSAEEAHKAIAEAAHALKSMALSAGAIGVASAAQAIEINAKEDAQYYEFMVPLMRLDAMMSATIEAICADYPALAA